MLEEKVEFVKVDSLKPRLRNVNTIAKVVSIDKPFSVASRCARLSEERHDPSWYRPARRPFGRRGRD